MTEVDSVRLLASEYNLEYVDLDRFPIDASAASVLPVQIARQHRVVPVARKFGAPVIAISDPGDIVAIDTLRTSIGREFISVVAAADQIDACLDRVYGNGSQAPPAATNGLGAAPVPGLEGLEGLEGLGGLEDLGGLESLDDADDFPGLDLASTIESPPATADHADPLAVALGDALTRPATQPAPASPRLVRRGAILDRPRSGGPRSWSDLRRRRDVHRRPRRGCGSGVRTCRW